MKRYGLVAAVAFFVGIGSFLIFHNRSVDSPEEKNGLPVENATAVQKQTRFRVHLYFADLEQRYLSAEERSVTSFSDGVAERAMAIVNALIAGPKSSLVRTLPKGTKLLALHVTGDGVAYVDFDRNVVEGHPKGTLSELLAIFSVVNTLALNLPEIQAVRILVEGREKRTLAGHVEIRFPFQPNLLMIK